MPTIITWALSVKGVHGLISPPFKEISNKIKTLFIYSNYNATKFLENLKFNCKRDCITCNFQFYFAYSRNKKIFRWENYLNCISFFLNSRTSKLYIRLRFIQRSASKYIEILYNGNSNRKSFSKNKMKIDENLSYSQFSSIMIVKTIFEWNIVVFRISCWQ